MLRYGPTTALIVVDLQNDFADPAGSLSVRGGEEVVGRVNDQVQRAVAAGAPVFYTQDWHPASTPHFAKDGGIWPVHCVADTWGADFHPNLIVAGESVRKGRDGEDGYSGFTVRDPTTGDERPTGLEASLRQLRVTEVVVCGLATDYCVRATALDAARLGFRATLLTDAVAAVDLASGDGERALTEMSAAGITLEPGAPGDAWGVPG
ncbi:MAG: isochorismatase family protein [Chloroflexota bacterium]|nr:isochorismatase family protein [Chloroflexota bacterium]